MKPNYIIIPIVTFFTAFVGSMLTSGDMAWYQTLKLPAMAPPGFAIGIVWTVIFILSAISALIVWNNMLHVDPKFPSIAILFLFNALLNIFWSFLFFNQHLIGFSIIEMVVLEATVIGLIVMIWPLSKWASTLLIPYAVWVVVATYLAYNIWILN